MAKLLDEFRQGRRAVIKDGAISVLVICILAVGIAATTSIVTVLDSTLYRSFPFRDSSRLVVVWMKNLHIAWQEEDEVSPQNLAEWRTRDDSFSTLAAFTWAQHFNVSGGEAAQRARGSRISHDLLGTLGVQPLLGRGFFPDDERSGNTVIISYGFWQSQFGGQPDVLSRTIRLNGDLYQVVGVLPRKFQLVFFGPVDVLIPLKLTPTETGDHGGKVLCVVGRLRPGIALNQASASMRRLAAQLGQQYSEDANWTVNLVPLREEGTGDVREKFTIFLGIGILILIIACANIANIQIARVSRRSGDLALQVALGASRSSIFRLLIFENLILAVIAGALGLIASYFIARELLLYSPVYFPEGTEIKIDWRTFTACTALSVLTALAFTLVPAFSAMRLNVGRVLMQSSARLMGPGKKRALLQRSLVTIEVALSFVLLVGAGLMIRTFFQIAQVNLGFDSNNLSSFQILLSKSKYPRSVNQLAFYQELMRRIPKVPGVIGSTAISHLPLSMNGMNNYVQVGTNGDQVGSGKANIATRVVMPNYFETMKIPLLRGRTFRDQGERAPVAIISQQLADRYFPGQYPIGKYIFVQDALQADTDVLSAGAREVIGVVADVHEFGPDKDLWPEAYFSYEQNPVRSMAVVVRLGESSGVIDGMRRQVMMIDADQPIYGVRSMREMIDTATETRRFQVSTIAFFAGTALLLAISGLYGVISFSVMQRRQEIGIRMALGADRAKVLRMILVDGILLGTIGIGLGVGGSFLLSQFIGSLLYGLNPNDPLILSFATLLLASIVLVACYVPAQRASKFEPATVLRSD